MADLKKIAREILTKLTSDEITALAELLEFGNSLKDGYKPSSGSTAEPDDDFEDEDDDEPPTPAPAKRAPAKKAAPAKKTAPARRSKPAPAVEEDDDEDDDDDF